MFGQIFGLPLHVLVLHAIVVLGPLAALTAIAYAIRPRWRWYLRWPVLALAVIAGVAGFVTGQSGEALQEQLVANGVGGTTLEMIEAHAQAGTTAQIVAIVFMVVTLGAVWFVLPAGPRPAGAGGAEAGHRTLSPALQAVTAGVVALLSVGLIVTVAIAGHLGATAAWSGVF